MIFNRPQATQRSFAAIRAARPGRLFLISDGPRHDRPGEVERVRQSRAVAEAVDWDCELIRIYADQNQGCGRRISSGISTALQHTERLVILEDDCVAEPSFFAYCESLLDRYADQPRVMAITGNNFQAGQRRGQASYYFSKYPNCWGWATWRRAWQAFDLTMSDWPAARTSKLWDRLGADRQEQAYWTKAFDQAYAGTIDTWDFHWTFACWQRGGLTAVPNVNLVSNIGFNSIDATHTSGSSPLANLPTLPLGPLVHCEQIDRNQEADEFTFRHAFGGRQSKRRNLLRRWWPQRTAAA